MILLLPVSMIARVQSFLVAKVSIGKRGPGRCGRVAT